MLFATSLGHFSADTHPASDAAVVVRAEDPRSLEALRNDVLPDLEILGDHAIMATDEWDHAVEALQRR